MAAPGIVAILLAAGSSRRFGSDKLLVPLRDKPLWRHALDLLAAHASRRDVDARSGIDEVLVVVRPGFDPGPLPPSCRAVINPLHEEGLASSLRAGVAAAPDSATAYLLALADMPNILPATLDSLLAFWREGGRPIAAPWCGGRRGHPVIVSSALRDELLSLRGEEGARHLLAARPSRVALLETPDIGVLTDIDKPEDIPSAGASADAIKLVRPSLAWPVCVLIKGAGEMASAAAHRLFRCGFDVLMTELPRPTAVRRTVSFSEAVFSGETTVEGVRAVRLDDPRHAAGELRRPGRERVLVYVDPSGRAPAGLFPDAVVDARLLKRNDGTRIDEAPLVIGLGPGFWAGRDVHAVVETNRGHHLGRILRDGPAEADTGAPGEIGGFTHERVLRAPAAGVFEPQGRIGDHVGAGEAVGTVAGRIVQAGVSGVIRGILHPGLEVRPGQKLGDIDPRGDPSSCFTLSDKARTISGSVLELVVSGCRLR